ncbi:RNA pseudouridylate synthase domain-containing protein 1 [Acipenser ruthenus]|uniref:RNA pseudouridylate synthase domain-containing protein 1 n=1 Tax=Acipenser ruthenus TaxID=7906 RepID=A0A444U9W5_ACIRT|nr:RNA pseudouridylate synthase domain-containing protein 1 [Acipenser ruthenus]
MQAKLAFQGHVHSSDDGCDWSSKFIVVNKLGHPHRQQDVVREADCPEQTQTRRSPELTDPDTCYGCCHQLDFSTSVVLCIALNKSAAGKAYRCFKEQLVTKAYLALVRGHVKSSRMTIDYAIGKNTTEGMTHMMCIEGTHSCENPKPCQSGLIVLEYGTYDGDPVTKILLKPLTPLTDRTHQLRVHCNSIGHPIVGDFTYSLNKDCAPYRMVLHAYFMRIPVEAEPIEVTAGDPFMTSIDPKWVPE